MRTTGIAVAAATKDQVVCLISVSFRPQVGTGLLEHYEGRALNLIRVARGSAVLLVELVTATFPGFRDHAIYRRAHPLGQKNGCK